MDLFKIFLKRLFYKIPFKLLLVIVIVLFLSLITIGSDVFAVTTDEWQKFSTGKNYVENTLHLTVYGYCYGVNAENGHTVICYKTHASNSNIWVNNSRTQVTTGGYCVLYDATSNSYTNLTGYSTTAFLKGNVPNCIYYTSSNIYTTGGDLVKSTNLIYEPFTNPYLTTSSSDIENMSFINLEFNAGSETGRYTFVEDNISYELVRNFKLEIDYNGITYTEDLRDYLSIDSNNIATFSVPRNVILSHFNVYNGQDISFSLYVEPSVSPNSTGDWSIYSLGTYTLGLTTQEQEQINADSNREIISAIDSGIENLNNTQQETNEKLDEINDTLTDTSNLPDFFTSYEDFAQNYDGSFGRLEQFEQIWQILYNAFYTDDTENLSVQIPFTGNNLTIDSHLTDFIPQQVKNFIAMISWGVVCVYIMKDVYNMKDLFMSGNMEHVGKNVKKGDL